MNKSWVCLVTAILLGSILTFLPAPVVAAKAGCGSIITTSSTLRANIGPCSEDGLIIGQSNITLNCAKHTIRGTGTNNGEWHGIYVLAGLTGVTIKNCIVSNFAYGFEFDASSSKLAGNTATGNVIWGFDLFSGNHNTVTNNTASYNNDEGFFIYQNSTTLTNNKAFGNTNEGFRIWYRSSGNILSKNTATSNGDSGFYNTNGYSIGNTLKGNIANGNNYGYYDLTDGSGTRGTGNSYRNDKCSTNILGGSYPTGLCTPQS